MNPKKCVVLVPFANRIEPDCDAALRELERRGYEVWRVPGFAAIDQARNQLATDALASGFDETMWIDSDIKFHPDDVNKLRAHELPLSCAIYPKKGVRELAIHVLPETDAINFGQDGGLVEIKYAGTGFLLVRRATYLAVKEKLSLPECNLRFGRPMIPFFMPLIVPDERGPWYLAEDFAFCERARQAGHRVMADSSIRLGHIGSHAFTWEDAGNTPKRFQSYRYRLT